MKIRYQCDDKTGQWQGIISHGTKPEETTPPLPTREAAEQWAHLNIYDPDTGRPIHKYKP